MKSAPLLALALAALVPACSNTPKTTPSAYISDPSFYFIAPHGPKAAAFNTSVDKAIDGDDKELAYILSLAKYTQGSGALNFGATLRDLRTIVGDERFDHALGTLTTEEADAVTLDMRAAERIKASVDQYGGQLKW